MSLPAPPPLADWFTSGSGGDIATPDAGTRATGWIKVAGVPPKPPYQWMNWFMGLTYTSIKWCQDSILTLAGSQLVPAGAVVQFAAASPPTGWLLCDGSAVSQVTYANLYSVLGTTWGPDAGGNFTLPDLRKAVLAGYDSSDTGTVNFATLGAVVGAKTHALSTGEMPGHTHPLTRYTGGSFPGPTHEGVQYDNVNQTLSATVSSQSTGSGDPHNIIQLSATVNHIIKY